MKYKCSYCGMKTTKKDSVGNKNTRVHIDCIHKINEQMTAGTVSLNITVAISGEQMELVDTLPDRTPRTDTLRLDLNLAVSTLQEQGKVQEANVLRYLLKGYKQSQLAKPLKVSRQRIGQIVQSLRKELLKMGINEYGYAK